MGVPQENSVLFLTELNAHLSQVGEELKEEPGKGRAVAGPTAALCQ